MKKSASHGNLSSTSCHGVPGCLPDADHESFFPDKSRRRASNSSCNLDSPSKLSRRMSDLFDSEPDEYVFQKTCRDAQMLAERRKIHHCPSASSTTSQELLPETSTRTSVKGVDTSYDVKDLIQAVDSKIDKLLEAWTTQVQILHGIQKTVSACPTHAAPKGQKPPQPKLALEEEPLLPSNGSQLMPIVPSAAWSDIAGSDPSPIAPETVPSNITPASSFGAVSEVFVNTGSREGSKQSKQHSKGSSKQTPPTTSEKTPEVTSEIPTASPVGRKGASKTRQSKKFSPDAANMDRRPTTNSILSDASIVCAVKQHQKRSHWFASVYYAMEEPESAEYGFIYVALINILLIGSSCLTITKLGDMWSNDSIVAFLLETIIDGVFTIEVFLRFAVCPNRVVFFHEYYNYVDMLAGMPPLVLRIVNFSLHRDTTENTADNILLGTVPVLRYLKLLRRFEKFHLLFKAFKLTFDALPVLLFTLTILILAFAAVFFVVEPRDNIPTLGLSWYAVTMTLTTVGYGDVYPVTAQGQAIMGLLSICSTLYLAIPVGIVGSAFSCVWNDRDRVLLFKRTRKRLREMGLAAYDIPSLFKYFDADRDGLLSITEFCHMVSQLKVNISLRRITELFRLIDTDSSGGIDDEEFISTLFPEAHAMIYSQKGQSDETTEAPQHNIDDKIIP